MQLVVPLIQLVPQVLHLPLQVDEQERVSVQVGPRFLAIGGYVSRLIQLINQPVASFDLSDELLESRSETRVIVLVVIDVKLQREVLIVEILLLICNASGDQLLAISRVK